MSLKLWQVLQAQKKKGSSLVPKEEDLAESRAFVRNLFEVHYSPKHSKSERSKTEGPSVPDKG